MRSIIQDEKRCYVSGAEHGLHLHHVMHGPHRNKSEKMGLTVWLRHDIHMALHDHRRPFENLDVQLKKDAQRTFEREHTREEWMAEFGRNYLD